MLQVIKRLLDAGVALQQIRPAVDHLRDRDIEDLVQITLMSDGASVHQCTTAAEVLGLAQGGNGVFGLAVGRVWAEVESVLATLPSETTDAGHASTDELAARTAARGTP